MLSSDFARVFKSKHFIIDNLKYNIVYINNFLLLNKINSLVKEELIEEIYNLTNRSWGDFGKGFIIDHVIKSDYLFLVYLNEVLIAYASVSKKEFNKNFFYYFEFLVVDPFYQKFNISNVLIFELAKKIIVSNLLKLKFNINLITISPNPIILGMISRRSCNMYPDPKLYINMENFPEADDKIWNIAKEVIRSSYNPNREISRKGLVLHESYKDTPWLIYDKDNLPHDRDQKVNDFCNDFLEYHNKTGKEFIVVAKICFLKLLWIKK